MRAVSTNIASGPAATRRRDACFIHLGTAFENNRRTINTTDANEHASMDRSRRSIAASGDVGKPSYACTDTKILYTYERPVHIEGNLVRWNSLINVRDVPAQCSFFAAVLSSLASRPGERDRVCS